MIRYNIEAVGGGGLVTFESDSEVKKAIEKHKVTVWVGGTCGICDDWGNPVEKTVKRVTRVNEDGTRTVIYERKTNKA